MSIFEITKVIVNIIKYGGKQQLTFNTIKITMKTYK